MQSMVELVMGEAEKQLSIVLNEPVKIVSNKSLTGGCISKALKLVTNCGIYFLKWNTKGNADMFIREAECLKELAKADSELIIPKVYGAKTIDTSPGFLILEYLEPGSSSVNADEKLGRGLAQLHTFEHNRFGFHENNYCGASEQNNKWNSNWSEFFADNRLGFLLQLIQQDRPLANSDVRVLKKLQEKIPDLLPNENKPVLIHGDLWSGNYMHTNNGPALIDPAAYYASREMEFAIITMFGGFSSHFFGAYNEINALPNDWTERNKLYQLYHILNHYYLFGGGYAEEALHIARFYI